MDDVWRLMAHWKLAGHEELELFLRMVLACFMGYMIGYERMNREKSAGMRTHAIVCLGAALIMIVSKYGFEDIPDFDASRVAAQIVSGVGFLGAGIIFVKNNTVSGLTTAAGIWTTAGVGMAIGAGAYFIGVSAGILVVVTQVVLHKATFFTAEPVRGYMKLQTDDYEGLMPELVSQFAGEKIRMLRLKVHKEKAEGEVKIEMELLYPPKYDRSQLVAQWAKDKRVKGISG